MQRTACTVFAFALLGLAACSPFDTPPIDEGETTSSKPTDETSSVRETPNVSYQGILEVVGPSIYMQGTHQLQLSDGRIILLESADIDLDRYVGKKVGVFGASRPTVEGEGIILRVEEVILLEEVETSSSSEQTSESPSSAASEEPSSSMASVLPPFSSAPTSKAPVVPPPPAASSTATTTDDDGVSTDVSLRADAMAKDKMDAAQWTQRYCTSHIGFCVPVHRNWWFKSFGTTTSSLWHVELSNSEIQNLGEGPIVLKLLSGNVASKKAADGQVRVQGDFVIGFKSWGANEHFEITAPVKLQAAVEYMTMNLTAQDVQ